MTAIAETRDEVRLAGTLDDQLRVRLKRWQDGSITANFEIRWGGDPEDYAEIDVPLETVMPLVLALGGSHTRYIKESL